MSTKGKTRKNAILKLSLALLLVGILIVVGLHQKGNDSSLNHDNLLFPYLLEKEELEITSVFSYTGVNPDYDEEDCEEVGAIQITNKSEDYLEEASIEIVLADGNKLQFLIEDIPAGKEVMAFDINNMEYDQSIFIVDINVDVDFAEKKELKEDNIKFEVNEDNIILTNTSDNEVLNIAIKYHCNLGEMFFGGKSYKAVIESLQPNEKSAVNAAECYLGEVSVVDVIY